MRIYYGLALYLDLLVNDAWKKFQTYSHRMVVSNGDEYHGKQQNLTFNKSKYTTNITSGQLFGWRTKKKKRKCKDQIKYPFTALYNKLLPIHVSQ